MLAPMQIRKWAGCAEASTLGLAPGEWPAHVEWGNQTWNRYRPIKDAEDEIVAVRYTSGDEYIDIIND